MKTQNSQSKVAVITGAASGIGKGLALKCAEKGMNLVLADIEIEPLNILVETLKTEGKTAIAVQTNVGKEEQIKKLANETLKAFRRVDFLFNNAGVGVGGTSWEAPSEYWNWAIDVNLKSVIHGLRYFVPIMLEQGNECYIVNTASLAGLTTGSDMAPYIVTKHAVVSLTETLFHDLAKRGSKIRTAVFCPTIVQSNIMKSVRNAPASIKYSEQNRPRSQIELEWEKQLAEWIAQGMSSEQAAECVFTALEAGKFYIFTHNECKPMVEARFRSILNDKCPVLPGIPA